MRILFQGDSITDAGRSRERDDMVGVGYPLLVKADLSFEEPHKYEFYNRGVSGNRIVDLYARIKADIVNVKPDVMSILIGVNDVWHEYAEKGPNGVDAEKYFKIYSMLLEEVRELLPETKIMILEPFTLKGSGNTAYWDEFFAEVKKRAEKVRKIAEKYELPFVPLQEKLEQMSANSPEGYWLADGVHPTSAGHELIKREWLKCFRQMVKQRS